jgi:hypothetical protein
MLIAAFSANGTAVPPKYADDPMPDLRDQYYLRFPAVK